MTGAQEMRFGDLVTRSPRVHEIFDELRRLAPTETPLLIRGEPGTGKRALARTVHRASARGEGPYVAVDCSLVDGLERALYGANDRGEPGALEQSDGGTLVLVRIEELPLGLQHDLLSVLQQQVIQRADASGPVSFDVRLVATSRRPLSTEVRRGKFREDLYAHVARAAVELPPLRERREDVPVLVEHLRPDGDGGSGQDGAAHLSADVLERLMEHDWPGNVRELEGVLARAATRDCNGSSTRAAGSRGAQAGLDGVWFDPSKSYRQAKNEWDALFEKRYVAWLLGRHAGNISAAARAGEMDRKYLHKLAKKHGLHPWSSSGEPDAG